MDNRYTNCINVLNTGIKRGRSLSMLGFSLVESLVTVFIFSLLFAALLMVLYGGQASWYTADIQTELNSEIRKPLLTMNKELRQTRSSQITNVPADGIPYPTITFRIPECQVPGPNCSVIDVSGQITWSPDITYSLNGNQIIRNPPLGSIGVLANNISTLEFKRDLSNPNVIEIYITAEKDTVWNRSLQASITSSVKMRN